MTNDERHDDIKELVPSYVLGALPAEEMHLVRAHIVSCDECMAEADAFSDTTASLALAIDPVELPKGFADRVVAAAKGGGVEQEATERPKRRWNWSFVPVLSGVALLLAFAVLGASVLQTRTELERKERALTALLHTDDGWDLAGENGAEAKMLPTENGALFVVAGLQTAPDAHTYQLWVMNGDEPASAGTFDVESGIAVLELDIDPGRYDAVAVTVEPAGGSAQPTSDPILVSEPVYNL